MTIERRKFLHASLAATAAVAVGCDNQQSTVAASAEPSSTTPASGPKPRPGATQAPSAAAIPAPDDVATPPADATKTASGLGYKTLQKGTGTEHPSADDTVKVNYTGWTSDGKMFDSSVVRNKPISFSLRQVIKGWTEGVQLMVVGEKARLWIPVELAYNNAPGKPAGQLTFDVELLEIKKAPPKPEKPKPPEPLPAPEDVAKPPKDAKKTKSGIYYKVLTPGTGKAHPKADSRVEVHYTGWTTDGKMFDSSVVKKTPFRTMLNGVIKGWTEGVQLMVEGEKTRFWIPADLAYGDKPPAGYPAGQLCFEIELLKIVE